MRVNAEKKERPRTRDRDFFFFEIGVLVIQADCLLHASAKREPKKTRRDSAVYKVCVMSVSNWPSERAPRLEREKEPQPRKGKGKRDALQLRPRSEGPRYRWTGRGFRREG
jgi:hypothetical protein